MSNNTMNETPKAVKQSVNSKQQAEADMRSTFQNIFHQEMMTDGTFTNEGWQRIKAAIAKFNKSR